jgi:uncharacterized membrane protein
MITKFLQSAQLTERLRAFLVLLIFFSTLWFCFITPAFDKPDENLHFYKAIAVSQGNFICHVQNKNLVNQIPISAYNFVANNFKHDVLHPITTQLNYRYVNEKDSCVLPFFYYIIPGFFIALLLNFSAPIWLIFFVGRAVNSIMALSILFFSTRKLPKKLQLLPLFIFSLPMVTFQISSYSKDVYHLSLGILLINLTLHFLHSKKMTTHEFLFFILTTLFFILTRIQYAFFILFILLLPHTSSTTKRFKKFHNWPIAGAIGTMVAAVSILFLSIQNNVYLTPYNENIYVSYHAQVDPRRQFFYLLTNPISFVLTMFNTLVAFGLFYLKGAIGILGWLDQPLPNFVYAGYIALGVLITLIIALSEEVRWVARGVGIFILVLVLTMLSLFVAMYMYGSPVGETAVFGLQGRYFIVLIPLLILLISISLNTLLKKLRALS